MSDVLRNREKVIYQQALRKWLEKNEHRIAEEDHWGEYVILSIEQSIEVEKIAVELEYQDKLEKDEAFRKSEKEKESFETWDDMEFDTFHLDLIKYKQTHSNWDFTKIWPELKRINKQLAKKYLGTLPMKARQIMLAEANSDDYSEFLTLTLLKAIEAWRPDHNVKFTTFYDRVVRNYSGNIKNRTNYKWYQNTELISLNMEGTEEMMEKIAKQHYKYDENGKMLMNANIKMFVRELNKRENGLGAVFGLLMSGRYTHNEIAHYMDCSTKTIQRKITEIRETWKAYE